MGLHLKPFRSRLLVYGTTHWRAVHVCLAHGLSTLLGAPPTAYSQIHQSSADYQFLADVSLCSSGHPVSFRLRFHDSLFPGAKRLLHLSLSLRRIFRASRQVICRQNSGHACMQPMRPLHSDLHVKRSGARGGEAIRDGSRSGLHEVHGLRQRLSERRFVFWLWQAVDPCS
jgi:hypothetical protein